MEFLNFDFSDGREKAILDHLASEGVVLWRGDTLEKDADDKSSGKLYLFGVVAGASEPEVFFSTSWSTSYRGRISTHPRVHMRVPLSQFCSPFIHGDPGSDFSARPLMARPGTDDAAVGNVIGLGSKVLSSDANTRESVYLTRTGNGMSEHIQFGIVFVTGPASGHPYSARVENSWDAEEFKNAIESKFSVCPPAPRF